MNLQQLEGKVVEVHWNEIDRFVYSAKWFYILMQANKNVQDQSGHCSPQSAGNTCTC